MIVVNPDAVEEYCNRILQIIVELRGKAKEIAIKVKSYNDKSATFTGS